jgi:hypothetical protein
MDAMPEKPSTRPVVVAAAVSAVFLAVGVGLVVLGRSKRHPYEFWTAVGNAYAERMYADWTIVEYVGVALIIAGVLVGLVALLAALLRR